MKKIIQEYPKYPKISILDLGCGKDSPIKDISHKYSLGIDLYEPYLKESKKKRLHTHYLKQDIRKIKIKELLEKNKGKKYDIVLLLGVIEHLEKKEGKILLSKIERLGRLKIICTPNAFQQQSEILEEETELQKHRSSWKVEDFKKRGYDVSGVAGFKLLHFLKGY
ncbi:unnamed protein product, partial [marine sediment metagenome]